MYAVRSLSVDNGIPFSYSSMYHFHRVYEGIKKVHGITPTRPRLPVTLALLGSMYVHLDMSLHDDRVLWAAFTLAVAIMLRISEFAVVRRGMEPPITHSDISFTRSISSHYQLRIKRSKTDQYAQGRNVQVFATNAITCPFRAMSQLMSRYPREVSRAASGSAFTLSSGRALNRYVVEHRLRKLLVSIGLNPEIYSTHSLRRGGATSYSLANVPDRMIKAIGNWTSESYKLYIDTPTEHIQRACVQASRITKWFGSLTSLSQQYGNRSVHDIGVFD